MRGIFGRERIRSQTAKKPQKFTSSDATENAQIAARLALVVTPGTVMSVDDSHQQYLRLPFSLAPDVLEKGIPRLAQAWTVYKQLAREKHTSINAIV